jgi:hypothetical protein
VNPPTLQTRSGHLVKRLKKDGFWVRGVDLKFHEFSETHNTIFVTWALEQIVG